MRTCLLIPLKQDDSPTLITSREVVTGMIEFYGGDDIGYRD